MPSWFVFCQNLFWNSHPIVRSQGDKVLFRCYELFWKLWSGCVWCRMGSWCLAITSIEPNFSRGARAGAADRERLGQQRDNIILQIANWTFERIWITKSCSLAILAFRTGTVLAWSFALKGLFLAYGLRVLCSHALRFVEPKFSKCENGEGARGTDRSATLPHDFWEFSCELWLRVFARLSHDLGSCRLLWNCCIRVFSARLKCVAR